MHKIYTTPTTLVLLQWFPSTMTCAQQKKRQKYTHSGGLTNRKQVK